MQSPFSSAWQNDLGNLVVPNVFMDVDLLKAVVDRYVPVLRVIRGNEGDILLIIRREEFKEIFYLYESSATLVQIDLNELKTEG